MIKKYFLFILTVIFGLVSILLLLHGCKHDPVYTNVCFQSQVLPIFANNCTVSGCHNSKDVAAGIDPPYAEIARVEEIQVPVGVHEERLGR